MASLEYLGSQNLPVSQQISQSSIEKPATMNTSAPPPLPYNLREHKPAIIIAFSIMLLFDGLMETVVFYPLYFRTGLSIKVVFAIIMVPAIWSLLDWGRRTWRMVQPSNEYRPLNAGRWTWDLFHINYTGSFPIITLFFALGSALGNQTLVSMPLPFLLTLTGLQLLLGAASYTFAPDHPTPIRFSSLQAGSLPRPPVYTIVEDIVAVNGGGGKTYRQAINTRYESSPVFRKMLNEMSWVWGSSSFLLGLVLLILVGVGSNPEHETLRQVAYGLSWLLPWLFAAMAGFGTIKWVQKRLKEEKATWSSVMIEQRV